MNQDALTTGYEQELREHFEPLPPRLHSEYYHYERLSSDLRPEISFYRSQFTGQCNRLLELGCGTSIIASRLAEHGIDVTGIDLCRAMLSFRPQPIANHTVQMDMCSLGFLPCFDGALIAHNTLNLLADEAKIRQCLRELKHVLISPGMLVCHLYAADLKDTGAIGGKRLQFHIFDLPTGEKIVKESITNLSADRDVLQIEQRYKYRNFLLPQLNRNYRQALELASFSGSKWLTILSESGFVPVASTSKFSRLQPDSTSTLIVTARACN